MLNIDNWMKEAAEKLEARFGERLVFVGLQGSFARREATNESDVDIVVVLDELAYSDLTAYREIVRSMPHSEKACGFISGREELRNWPKSDLLQFQMETIPWRGTLAGILPPLSDDDIRGSVQLAAANLYHAAAHVCVHTPDAERVRALKGLYKSAFFALQSLHRLETCRYAQTKEDLLGELDGTSREILKAYINRDSFTYEDEDECLNLLITWCGEILRTL